MEFNGKLDFWDLRYYTTLSEEIKYSVDKEKLRDYFPMETVTKGLLEIYQQLLGITFIEVQDPEKWHEDVKLVRKKKSSSFLLAVKKLIQCFTIKFNSFFSVSSFGHGI